MDFGGEHKSPRGDGFRNNFSDNRNSSGYRNQSNQDDNRSDKPKRPRIKKADSNDRGSSQGRPDSYGQRSSSDSRGGYNRPDNSGDRRSSGDYGDRRPSNDYGNRRPSGGGYPERRSQGDSGNRYSNNQDNNRYQQGDNRRPSGGGGYRSNDNSQGSGYGNRRPNDSGSGRPFKPELKKSYGRSSEGGNSRNDRPYNSRSPRPGGQRSSGGGFDARKNYNKDSYHVRPNYDDVVVPDENQPIRLNKYIANSGVCSRREADEYIKAGLITVNGELSTELGRKVLPTDDVRYNGERLNRERKVYILLNKPKDFVTSVDDPNAKRTVMDLVHGACKERVYPVGRLDRMTTGVLLLTNDGELTKKLTHPQFEKKKIYQVMLDKKLDRADMAKIAEGLTLEDGFIAADAIDYTHDDDKKMVGIEIHSGRNRIVRRIFEYLGYKTVKLDRVYFAGLTKKGLSRGEWRFLTEREVRMLHTGSYE